MIYVWIVIVCFHFNRYFVVLMMFVLSTYFFFQAEDGIRDAQESRGLGDVYKRQFSMNLEAGSRLRPAASLILDKYDGRKPRLSDTRLSLIHI